MKKTLVSLMSLVALASLMSMTSCQKEQIGNGTQFRAAMEDCPSQNGKTVLDGTALNWVSGDQIVVYGTTGSGIYTATPQNPATTAVFDNVSGETGDGPFRAYYPSTLTTDGVNITLPATQTYMEGSVNEFPMYAESATNQLAFKNLCGLLKLHLTKANTSISSIEVVTNSEVNGTFSISYNGGVPVLAYVSGGTNNVTLTCATAQDISEGADFYITLPATFDSVRSITLTDDNGMFCTKRVNNTSQISVSRSQYTLITLGENDLNFTTQLHPGALPGLFSVSATQQVHFSQGNLQYQASTDTWRFAGNQYDYVGSANSNISSTYSGWIDLFGWGTGNNPTLASTNDTDYSTFVDWGSNAIINGGNAVNQWRTLTDAEWDYLLNSRTNASSKRGTGNINGVGGLIILPDTWTQPSGCPQFNPVVASSNGDWTHNSYTLAQWAQMEAAGAVFLPAAGWHFGASTWVTAVGLGGIYWSSTPTDSNYNDAYGMSFPSRRLDASLVNSRYCGSSVRLVR